MLDNDHLNSTAQPAESLKSILLFLALSNGVLYWPNGAAVIHKNPAYHRLLKHWFDLNHTQLILGEEESSSLAPSLEHVSTHSITLKPLAPQEETTFWEANISAVFGAKPDIAYSLLSDRYYPDYGRVRDSLKRTRQTDSSAEIKLDDIYTGYLDTAAKQISTIAFLAPRRLASIADIILASSSLVTAINASTSLTFSSVSSS